MPLYSIGRTSKIRAKAQATASLETKEASVTRTYANAIRVTNCDVIIKGQQKTLFNVPNSSVNNWSAGDTVLVNLVRGNSNRPQIIGAAGATTSNSVAGNLNALATGSGGTGAAQQLAGIPFLLEEQSSQVSSGLVVSPGVNVYFLKTSPALTSGGYSNGGLTIFMKRLVLTSLPDASTTQLLDGILVDLVDSYRNQLGMYRLDKSIPAWVREDIGSYKPYIDQPLTGTVNGINTSFKLPRVPVNGFSLYADGIRWISTTDYTLAIDGVSITTTIAPNGWIHADIF